VNRNKNRGSLFEREIVKALRYHGHRFAERAYGAGRPDDVGDISGILGGRVVIEAKDCKAFDLSGWLAEAEKERINARADFGVVVAKRRGKSAQSAYAILTLDTLARLLKEVENA
jgi:hypothetical protein